ncbi:MAG TPA: polyhydroxyalkanoate synthesis repressor PhaR [Steroidobacteraceae bacterium]|nr:polyhydroxyalkanoate synthesis repressor PhaR [Steroidobacteraceae bacterium]
MSEQTTPRVIKKYPNRRLYDTQQSRYITLSDIRRLVMEKQEFVVIDQKSHEDITRSILLQVIAEQENGEPMMSQDFLSQIIRAYGSAMQGFVGTYLENSLKLFANQQQQLRERMNENGMIDPFTAFANLTQKNMEFWRGMQDQFFSALNGSPSARKPSTDSDSSSDMNPAEHQPQR